MGKWAGRLILFLVGWRLAMVYPLDDRMPSVLLSLGIGTAGVVWVAAVAYMAGRVDGRAGGRGGGAGMTHGPGIMVVPLTFQAIIYCARCGERYVETQQSRQQAEVLGSPLSADIPAWREYLSRLGWMEGGTVCLGCSEKRAVAS